MLLEPVAWEGVLCLGSGVPRDADGRDTHGDQPGRAGLSKTQRGRGNGGNQWLVCVCVCKDVHGQEHEFLPISAGF